VRYYEQSLELARRVQSVADEGRGLLRLAEVLLKAGDRQAARQHAVEAGEAFQRANMPLEAARARDLVRQLDSAPPILQVDPPTGRVWVRGAPVHLEPQELELLRLLCQHAGEIVMHAQIRDLLFPGSDWLLPVLKERIYPLVFNLRKALEENPARPELLLSRYGKGYLLLAPCLEGSV
jgi:DNA-binding response OmpR family regulator